MNIMINGPDLNNFDFNEALDVWIKSKSRIPFFNRNHREDAQV